MASSGTVHIELGQRRRGRLPFQIQSDVYSFAMLGVEVGARLILQASILWHKNILISQMPFQVVTRDRPFNHRKMDTIVILDVTRGRRPRRPTADSPGAADL